MSQTHPKSNSGRTQQRTSGGSTGKPLSKTLQEANLFESLPPRLKEICKEEWRNGRRGLVPESGYSDRDSARTRSQALQEVEVISETDARVALATDKEIIAGLMRVAYVLARDLDKERATVLCNVILYMKLTRAEWQQIMVLCSTNARIAKEITFAKAITPPIIDEARQHESVLPCRLYTYKDALDMYSKMDSSAPFTDFFSAVRYQQKPFWKYVQS